MSSSDSEERDSDIENVAPVLIANGDKKVDLPAEFFEYLGDVQGKKVRFYKCKFEGCKPKIKKDGTQKHLIAHDRKGNLGHEEKWRAAILKMSGKENVDITRGPSVKLIVQKSDLHDWIMGLITCSNFVNFNFLRFSKMFTDNELRLATISNPMFKLSWLENEEQYNRAKSLLICEFNRVKGSIADSISSEDSSDGTSSSRSDPSPEKRMPDEHNHYSKHFSDRYSDLEDFGKKINELSQPLADEESQETVLISGDDEKVGEGTSAEGTVFKKN
ncbi:hypothetical protein DAPPUDRAFT_328020 [Daphnia pulex]|uniref:Uncharacterized protein n=1 Tax=Daphnia pulex TaxID=6669 RepID=E9HCJ2_DAPPU|nr:hypothetical protein DAPPUDRAFT_328020 [Daphnia pulex]|eukprot:EFX70480.1 hypothetical protein DAPPUDRAFT_328020 [Daphnia pulex]